MDIWERRKYTGGMKVPAKVGLIERLKNPDAEEIDYTDIYPLNNGVGYAQNPVIIEKSNNGWHVKGYEMMRGSGLGASRVIFHSQTPLKNIKIKMNKLHSATNSRIVIQYRDINNNFMQNSSISIDRLNNAYNGYIYVLSSLPGEMEFTVPFLENCYGLGLIIDIFSANTLSFMEVIGLKIVSYFKTEMLSVIWDRSNTAIWKPDARSGVSYDSNNPTIWEGSDLLQVNEWIQPAYQNRLFVKVRDGVIKDVLTYDAPLTGFALQKTINYCK